LIIVPFERVKDFKYLGTTLKNRDSIQEEIMGRLKPGNEFRAESFAFFLLYKNLKINIYRTIILPVVFMGVKLGRSH
jgi:hypothetical protein